jgi:hypothetical protein
MIAGAVHGVSKGEVIVDETRWPVVIARWPPEPTVEGTNRYFDRVADLLARRQRFSLVLDATAVSNTPATVRREAGTRLNEQREVRRIWVAGEATISRSLVLRGVLTAIYWLAPPGYPTHVCDDELTACNWARRQLEVSGASPPFAKVG